MTAPNRLNQTRRRWPLVAVLAVGLGVAAAPLAFQMFDRAPKGGDMIDGFAPYMTDAEIEDFRADLADIGAARDEVVALPVETRDRYPSVAAFVDRWPAIDADMGSMLTTMQANIGHYDGVASLPPFPLFPWFFVLPGVLVAGVAGWSLAVDGGSPARGRRIAMVALAAGLVAAPAVFQMFTRAPAGAQMIDDFKPFMTEAKVTQIQGYFLTIGAGEGQLRLQVLPDLAATGAAAPLPAVEALNRDWPGIAGGMAPMIGAMADNVDNFDAVVALPPFWLFPWFFVLPGVIVAALVAVAGRSRGPVSATDEDQAGRHRVEPVQERV